ncbi:hypothetical protein HY345_01420, partial [Candidatus Microgenomates bacterium]|nr:hypothetical protein [Candidatus Microgenomates bacterium]
MPELPEVATIAKDLKKSIVGTTIIEFFSTSPQQIIPSLTVVKKAIERAKIIDVQRRAKLILLVLKTDKEDKKYLGIHLKMTGRLLLRKTGEKEDLFTRAVFTLEKTRQLRFCDVRKFGYLRLFINEKELQKMVHARLGPEPFSGDFSTVYLKEKLKSRSINIKALIM